MRSEIAATAQFSRPIVYGAALTVLLWQLGCSSSRPPGSVTVTRAASQGAAVQFVDMSEEAGIAFTYSSGHEAGHHSILEWLGGGVALLDYDGDGVLDVALSGGGDFAGEKIAGRAPALLRAVDAWRFEHRAAEAGLDQAEFYSHGCHVADYDNDGFADLLVTGYGGLQLFHNRGDGTFDESRVDTGLTDAAWSSSAAWGDLDGDGNVDLYVSHYVDWSFSNHPRCEGPLGQRDVCAPKQFQPLDDVVYYSNGDGSFRNATTEAGLVPGGKGLGVLLADFDLDLDLDIYVANDTTENFLYVNHGSGAFQEVGILNGVSGDDLGEVNGSMGVDVGDYDADGLPDIWVANYVEEPFALYKNLGGALFQHVTRSTGLNSLGGVFVGFGTGFIDVDSDGDEDLVIANGHVIQYPSSTTVRQLPLIMRNDGGSFERVDFRDPGYFSTKHLGRGLAWGDLDDDGDTDLVVSHLLEPVVALRNDTSSSHRWLRVRAVGQSSNRDAIGASLTLQTSRGARLRLIKGGGSYLSQADIRPSWSLASGERAERLTIRWPSGEVSTLTDLPINDTLTVIEPERHSDAATPL